MSGSRTTLPRSCAGEAFSWLQIEAGSFISCEASTPLTRFDAGVDSSQDAIERQSAKPAFQVLIYPAIPKDMKLSKETPPAFLLCGENDRQNISQGLPELYLSLKRAGASAELHVYSGVGHGFGMRETLRGPVSLWTARFHEWLDARGLLKAK